uniref:RNA recognition motif domain, eukaryote, nucleotide-binding alpha-beta plait domain protein n=1 Tax=Tanacetum cinerariifolium TaxID=118510 RepID=A0A6L2N0Z5_TANCI|nr:RNA recognition motif domain, eukaryote, nucleotide-binding alpha-beta plait domain protein [Tanacetum cinerariifolium]
MWVQTDAFLRRTGIGNLFVKNLAVDIDVGKLKDVFGVFGRIISCFGYVQFDSEEPAAEALRATVAKYLNKSERKEAQFTNVYVKNLDVDFTESSLIEKFSEYGKVTSAVIVNDAEGKSRGFGFVNFESHENAKKAINALNDAKIGSKKWFVGKAMKKSERDAILKRAHQKQKPVFLNLLVRNLATSVNENDLREVFGAFGCVTSAKVICDENGISRGFAFVCFSKSEDAKKAIRSLNGLYYYGKYIHVSIALSKEEYDRHLQTLVSLQYMFPFRDMVPQPAEKEDLVPNYQELLEKQVEKENRVPKLKKPLKRQVELEDRDQSKFTVQHPLELFDLIIVDFQWSKACPLRR